MKFIATSQYPGLKETSSSENKGPAITASLATSTPRNVVEKPMENTA